MVVVGGRCWWSLLSLLVLLVVVIAVVVGTVRLNYLSVL